TSTLLAYSAHKRGHEVFLVGVGELTCRPDNHIVGTARVPSGSPRKPATFLDTVQGDEAERADFSTEDIDVMWLRYNPAEAVGESAWARHAGFHFGQLAMRHGVLVLNHPYTLPYAINKMYLQHFPESVRPRALISRSTAELRAFYEENGRRIVLKPLEGYGGADVFCADDDDANLNQMIAVVRRSGYVLAQEFLPAAADGDVRLFLMNGRPLQIDGHFCAIRRVGSGGDFRSNISAGGKVERVAIDDGMLELAEALRPKLIEDGIFLCGIDIVGDRLVEINAVSAGGMQACERFEEVPFGAAVVEAVERKVEHRRRYEKTLSNRKLAVLE
ncbi:MAG: glutathione synthase, partial [Longimicrobiales bacterium]